jgi:hypothetical protein
MRVCIATGSASCDGGRQLAAKALLTTRVGEPDAGNLHVRFDEGEQLSAAPYSTALARSAREHECSVTANSVHRDSRHASPRDRISSAWL